MKKTISAVIDKGNTHHNNRKIITENVDKDKISNNLTIVQNDIKSVYHEHIRHSRQEKEFHEVIFQIGNRDDTHIGTTDAKVCADILKQFAKNFQRRNPHLRVFNAVIHMDEETPHLHIDFVPFATEQKRGLSTRVSLTKALEQQGFKGEGKLNTASKL
ncbi:MAG: plasmid recombination protein [Ruminococcus sp.]|nr:plasmid recombination protein [Ruminococcus sp.]